MGREFRSFDPNIIKAAADYFDNLPKLSDDEEERIDRITNAALDQVTGRKPGTTYRKRKMDELLGATRNNLVLKNGPIPEDYPLPGDTNYPQRQN